MASLGNLFITLVVIVAAISSVNGQSLDLRAVRLGTTPFTAYYLTGQNTSQIGIQNLPSCLAVGATGSLIQLTNTNTGVVVGEHTQPFADDTFGVTPAAWDFTLHPTLNPSYTGLYRCTSDITGRMTATQTYQLHVVAPPATPVLQTPVSVYNDTVYNINCTGEGYPEPTVTLMVNNVVLTGSNTTNCTGGVCTKTHTASLDGSTYTPGQSINITCTVDINQPPFTCTAADTSSVQAQCNDTAKTTSQTRTVPVVAQCPAIDASERNYKPIATNSTGVSIECKMGYVSDNGMDITNSTCLNTGEWQPSLPMCEDCNTICNDSSIMNCSNIMVSNIPGISCPCDAGEIWTRSDQACVATHCSAETRTATVNAIPRLEVGASAYVTCNASTSTQTGINVTCMPDGTLSNKPACPALPSVPPSTPTPEEGGGGLETGAIVGIAVGGAVLAIVLVVIIILVIKKPPR
ncbi:uncharacterized protein LOC135817930 isoform X2 [Sycon ciliatum]|uniref:uncharacterized protein LOC135817930 isoform X2 n=1 Tax=Sycon ciliatum TaxID=27933 RepID=UPI0031F613F1